MVRLVTKKEHRFGRVLNVCGQEVMIGKKGEVEVETNQVAHFLLAGFELVDKTVKFDTLEEQAHIKEVQGILESAKLQAQQIIDDAQKEAEKIKANVQKELAARNVEIGERQTLLDELNKQTIAQLREHLLQMEVPKEVWDKLNKSDLIKYIFQLTYPDGLEE